MDEKELELLEEHPESFGQVIRNPGFVNLWVNQILVQLAYNALNFALIIWVFRLTGSNTAVSALLFAVYLPAVIFGLFAGVLVDVSDRKKIIIAINLLLSLLFFSLIFLKFHYSAILAIAFLVNTLAQFYVPAESSAIPIIVKKSQLLIANSLFSTTLFSSFLIGFALAGPFINHLGINFVFGFGGISLLLAFLFALKFPSVVNKSDSQGRKLIKSIEKADFLGIKQVGLSEIKETVKMIKRHYPLLFSIAILGGVQTVIGMLAVLIPAFFERVLQIKATDASQVIILPLGLGMILGGFIIGRLGHRFAKRSIVGKGVLLAGLLFFAVGVAPLISPVINYFPGHHSPLPFFYQPPLSAVLAIGSFFLGMTMVSIVIPSQTVLQESTPEEDRGKVFAVLGTVMAGMSLIPVLVAGILADIFGALPIFIAMGGAIALCGLLAIKPDFYFEEHHLPFQIKEFLGLGHWRKGKA
jgi:MFS family permease